MKIDENLVPQGVSVVFSTYEFEFSLLGSFSALLCVDKGSLYLMDNSQCSNTSLPDKTLRTLYLGIF